MIKKTAMIFICFVVSLLLGEGPMAGNLQPKPVDTQEFRDAMQKHINEMRFARPGRYGEMVDRAGGNIANCCSCHVELCRKGAGKVFTR